MADDDVTDEDPSRRRVARIHLDADDEDDDEEERER